VFALAMIVYGVSAGLTLRKQSKYPQYVYLSYSFLHGRLDLIETPANTFDLILYQDRWYVPGGMMPALLLLPIVAVGGTGFSDVLFGVLIGAVNVALMYGLLGDLLPENRPVRIWLTILFGVGTAHWWLSSVGSVWFNAQIVAVMFMIPFVRQALRGTHPWLAGLWLGLAGLSRPTALFAVAFYLVYLALQDRNWQAFFRKLIPFGLTLSAAVGVMLAYNYFRFGAPLEFGYGYVQGSGALIFTYAAYSGFNVRYMPCNMYVSLVGLPNLRSSPLPTVNEVCWYLEPVKHVFGKMSSFFNPLGMSMFLATPALLFIFWAKLRDNLVIAAWAGTICVLIPLWMYHTTGYVQFGYRYVLDFIVFLFIMLAGAIRRIGALEGIAIGASIAMNAIGLYLMYFMTFRLDWYKSWIGVFRKLAAMLLDSR